MLGCIRLPPQPRAPGPNPVRSTHRKPIRGETLGPHVPITNRAEVLRLIAEVHDDWALVAERNRAESLNQWVKRHWPDKRGPAVGKHRQQMRLTFAAIGLNVIAAIRYRQRTGIDILGPPGTIATAA